MKLGRQLQPKNPRRYDNKIVSALFLIWYDWFHLIIHLFRFYKYSFLLVSFSSFLSTKNRYFKTDLRSSPERCWRIWSRRSTSKQRLQNTYKMISNFKLNLSPQRVVTDHSLYRVNDGHNPFLGKVLENLFNLIIKSKLTCRVYEEIINANSAQSDEPQRKRHRTWWKVMNLLAMNTNCTDMLHHKTKGLNWKICNKLKKNFLKLYWISGKSVSTDESAKQFNISKRWSMI